MTRFSILLATASVFIGCSDDIHRGGGPVGPPDPPEDVADSVSASWISGDDGLLGLVLGAPPSYDRFTGHVRLDFPNNVEITRVSFDGAPLAATSHLEDWGAWLHLAPAPLEPGDRLTLVGTRDGEPFSTTLRLPQRAAPTTHLAIDALETGDGTRWTATPYSGLVGLTRAGDVVHYTGVALTDPYDPAFAGPQSGLLFAIAPVVGEPALWVASAMTGVSRFTPGIATDRADDVWEHSQPLDDDNTTWADDASQTVLAMAPVAEGLWAATLNGVFFVDRDLAWTRVADGVATTLDVDAEGRVWIGFTTQLDPNTVEEDTIGWPRAHVGLTLIAPSFTDGTLTAYRVVDSLELPVVTAIAAAGDRVFVGTPNGLAAYRYDGGFTSTPLAQTLLDGLAVSDLEPGLDGDLWVTARAECEVDRGRLLRIVGDDVTEVSLAALGERDPVRVRALPDGTLFLSTFVGTLASEAPLTSSGCEAPPVSERTADSYLIDPTDGAAERYGE